LLDYELSETTDYLQGTDITVELLDEWQNKDQLEKHIRQIVKYSNLAAQVFFNGELLEQATPGLPELSDDISDIRKCEYQYLIVRFKGLFMFSQYAPANQGYYFDCKLNARDSLSQNRESWRDKCEGQTAFQKFYQTLTQNTTSGISCQVASKRAEKQWNGNKFVDGIYFKGDAPLKLSKRQKSLCALALVISEMAGQEIGLQDFGFFNDNSGRGYWDGCRIYLNSNYFDGDDYELGAIGTIIHELSHRAGHDHSESFILHFQEAIFAIFLKNYSGINPIRAKVRQMEKQIFPKST
jgi:hypothetical protein